MKRLVSDIRIGGFRFDYVNNVDINQSWDTFTDTAVITLPSKLGNVRHAKDRGKTIVIGKQNLFNRGDQVVINIGYFPNLIKKFTGYINRIKPDGPLVIECEDRMFLFKEVNLVSKEFRAATIKTIVEYATDSQTNLKIEYDDDTAIIGNFSVNNSGFINAVTVFKTLKKQFGYSIYFQDGVLQVRLLKAFLSLKKAAIKMNMQFNIVANNLNFQRDDDVGMLIRFESKQDDDTVLTFYGHKVDGEAVIVETTTPPVTGGIVHQWKVPELTVAQIKNIMTDQIDRYIWEGYLGTFTTFGDPSIVHSDKIDMFDDRFPERQGTYLVKSVQTGFGVDGFRQTVQLRNRVA